MAESSPSIAGSSFTPAIRDSRSQEEWERLARDLLEEGQNFLAHDMAREGLKTYPDSLKLAIFGAVALSQSGALDEARKLLQPVLDLILIDEGPFHRLHASLKRAVEVLGSEPDKTALSVMADLAEALELVRGKKLVATADSETYTALAGVFREAWMASGDRRDLEHGRELFMRAFQTGGTAKAGIDAAVSSWLLDDQDRARIIARLVADKVSSSESALNLSPEDRYQLLITVATAQLLLGEADEALASFAWASTLEGIHYSHAVAALKQLKMLEEGGLFVPPAVEDIIKAPTVVVFTGHPLDRPGEGPHFPPELESAVRAEIARSLDELGAQIGYSMAACGSDLLFIEAMLERGAEVNVVMPYAIDDFIAENVRYGGSRWEMRFRNALKLASTVTYATEERYLGHGMLYRFSNQCLHGLATLRASFLTTAPTLLAVWDMMPGSLVGGAGDFIDQWEDISRLRIIDLDSLLQARPDLAGDTPPALPDLDTPDDEQGEGRVIRSMMFCDIAGYSRLKEEHTPVFLDFLRIIHDGMAKLEHQPIAINTWGDAIFAVMDKATSMAEYAQALQDMVALADAQLHDRLPHPLSLRISLHAGPVFQAIDPICGRPNFYGSHINRAARLEPVTVIGHVYATQQFVAVLTAEQSAARSEAQNRGEAFEERFACEYVGVLSLAKDFGRQAVYHLRRRAERQAMEQGLPLVSEGPSPDEQAEISLLDEGFSDSDLEALVAQAVAAAEAEEAEKPLDPLVFGTVLPESEGEPDPQAFSEEGEEDVEALFSGNTALSDADMAALLEEVADGSETDPDDQGGEPLFLSSTALSEADMDALLEEVEDGSGTDPDPDDQGGEPLFPSSTALSDADMAALLEEVEDGSETDPDPDDQGGEPLFPSSTALSDADMNALLAESDVTTEDVPVEGEDEEEPPLFRIGTPITDDDILALGAESEPPPFGTREEADSPLISDADLDALMAEAEAPGADRLTAPSLSEEDILALLAEVEDDEETPADSFEEMEQPAPPPVDLGHASAMSDDDLAALLEEAQGADEAAEEEPVLAGFISDDDLAAIMAEAGDTVGDGESGEDDALDPDLEDVAAAVRAAMAQMETEDESPPGDIHLAPPRAKD